MGGRVGARRAPRRPCVHPRIGVVLGRDGGMLAKIRGLFAAGLGGPVGDGRQWISRVHVDDVVRALLFAIDAKPGALDGPFNVTAPKPVR